VEAVVGQPAWTCCSYTSRGVFRHAPSDYRRFSYTSKRRRGLPVTQLTFYRVRPPL